jgi:hypothetical protein
MIRMQQLAGKLSVLGYSRMVILTPDYELEGYLVLSKEMTDPVIRVLYAELKRKKILEKWPILSSHILTHYNRLPYQKEEWKKFCLENKLPLLLNACIRANHLTPIEIKLLTEWCHFMKYPSH